MVSDLVLGHRPQGGRMNNYGGRFNGTDIDLYQSRLWGLSMLVDIYALEIKGLRTALSVE